MGLAADCLSEGAVDGLWPMALARFALRDLQVELVHEEVGGRGQQHGDHRQEEHAAEE